MKSLVIALTMLLSFPSFAQEATAQRALTANYDEYRSYLIKTGRNSYGQSYMKMTENFEITSPSVEECLMDLMQEVKNSAACDKAIYDLTRRPLNNVSREVLASLLSRLSKSSLHEKQFFNSFLNSLLTTHPEIKNNLKLKKRTEILAVNTISKMEYQAWLKITLKKADLREIKILMNGKSIPSIKNFQPPQGVYQWSFVTDTYQPVVYVGTWQQFTAKTHKNLMPFFNGSCEDLQKFENLEAEILNLEVFVKKSCVNQSNAMSSKKIFQASHVSHLPNEPEPPSLKKNTWLWGSVITAVGVGALAASMQNKRVKVTMPGFN